MKISTGIKLLALCLAISNMAFAQTGSGIDTIKNTNNAVGLQFISTNVNYTETSNGVTLDTEKGNVPGFAINVSLMQDWLFGNDYLAASYSQNNGNTNYTGSYIGSSKGYGSVTASDPATLIDYSLRYGKGFALGNQWMVTPFIEIGSHQWNRNLNTYQETYTNGYYGAGLLGQVAITKDIVITANGLIGNTVNSNINISGIGFNGGSLGNSSIYRIGLSGDYAFTRSFHGNIGIDYVSFSYGQSAGTKVGKYVYYEPPSTTQYTTYKVGVSYNF